MRWPGVDGPFDDRDRLIRGARSHRLDDIHAIGCVGRQCPSQIEIEQLGGGRQDSFERRQNFQLVREIAGNIRVGPRHSAGNDAANRRFGNRRDNLRAEPARQIVFMHDQQFSGPLGRFDHRLAVPRRNGSQVDQIDSQANCGDRGRGFFAKLNGAPPGDDRQMIAARDKAGLADRNKLSIDVGGSGRVAIVEAHLRIKKQRRPRRLESRIEQARGIGRGGRHENIDARHVRGDRFHGLRMERAQPGAITAAGSHDDDRASPFAGRAPVHRAQFGHDLIQRHRKKIGELQERDRPPIRPRPDRC